MSHREAGTMSESERIAVASASASAELRLRFKAICAATEQRFQNYQIRIHRALSWWERANELDPDENPEGRLLFAWIAFNALYGSWDDEGGAPAKDRACWGAFLSTAVTWDHDGLLSRCLREQRDPILSLLDNKYLDSQFWRRRDSYGGSRRQYYLGQSMYAQERWCALLVLVVDRIYVLRSQIVHGAATRNSSLNRNTLREALRLLEAVLGPVLQIAVEHGAHDAWPTLCYPPVNDAATDSAPAVRKSPR
jgi:hypothetical protein